MLKVGITGGIGSGKSLVAKIFNNYGIPIFYADYAAKYLMQHDEELKLQLIQSFGAEIFSNNVLQNKILAQKVFNNTEQLHLLNSLVHPKVIAYGNKWHLAQKAPYTIKEAALFFESGSYKEMDIIIGVYAPIDVRIERTIKRDNTTKEEVLTRIEKQMSEEEKMKLCNFVINNYNDYALLPQIEEIHHQLLKFVK